MSPLSRCCCWQWQCLSYPELVYSPFQITPGETTTFEQQVRERGAQWEQVLSQQPVKPGVHPPWHHLTPSLQMASAPFQCLQQHPPSIAPDRKPGTANMAFLWRIWNTACLLVFVEGKNEVPKLIYKTNKKVMNTIVSKHDLPYFWSQPTFEVRHHPCSDTRRGGFVPAALGAGMPSQISLPAAGTKFEPVFCHHVCKWRQMYYAVTAGSIQGRCWVSSPRQRAVRHSPGTTGLPWHHCPPAAYPARPCPGGTEASASEHGPGGLLWNSFIPGAWLLPGTISNCTSSPGQSSLLGLPSSELSVWLWFSLFSARLLVRA